MSILKLRHRKIKEDWSDSWDPYGYGRLMAHKATYVTILFFMTNLFFKSPSLIPVVSMLSVAVGMLLIELPQINTYKLKDSVYLGYIVMVSFTIAIFNLTYYLKIIFIVIVMSWCFLLHHALKKKSELFPIISIVFLVSFISLEAFPKASLNGVGNRLLFIIEYALVAFIAHKLYPNRYFLVYRKALCRLLESLLANKSVSSGVSHHVALRKVLPLLTKNCQNPAYQDVFTASVNLYYGVHGCRQLEPSNSKSNQLIDEALTQILIGISNRHVIRLSESITISNSESAAINTINDFAREWNKLCEKVLSRKGLTIFV